MATANMDIQASPHRRMLRPRRQRTCSERKDLSEKRLIGQFYSYRCPWSRSPSKLHTHLIDEAGWGGYFGPKLGRWLLISKGYGQQACQISLGKQPLIDCSVLVFAIQPP
ncbi:hypothetical protein T02_12333 [Trichinella nativa]|uniref:Uncharacterized protein n=1 Tax=Trichinella nativa TaxID=6335 RepID=A0A0V1LCY8_9BILA|nr:hypothetical protein T02_12333 [Trichinella nativa]